MENEELVQKIQFGINPTPNMEQLYLQNRSLIYQQAKKYAVYADMEDLMQEAYFGLYEAVKHYNPGKEVKFTTYLGYRIQSVLRRYVDNNRHIKRIPVHMVERISKYEKYIAEQKAIGIIPSDFLICKNLEITEQQLKNLRKAIYESECISTSDLLPGTDNFTVEDTIADPLDLEEEVVEEVALKQAETLIWKIVGELEKTQSAIIVGRYKESLTLQEIGKRLNLSNERIRVIEKNALSILRKKHEISNIAEIYGYMNVYKGTGLQAFKNNGSSVERTVIRHIEGEEKIKKIQKTINERKEKIIENLNIDELFQRWLILFYSKEMGIKIYQNQKDFLNVVRVYNQQVEVLVGIVGKSNRKQLEQLMPILKKLKSSCQKLVDQREQFKKCAFNLQKHKALLLPHINLLKETKAEIENVVKWFELKY